MISAWRLTKAKYAGDLSGEGASISGQRWNHPGHRVVYLGMSPAIVVLELVVHINDVYDVPFVLCEYTIPDTNGLIESLSIADLPEGWNAIPSNKASSDLGTQWLSSRRSLGLIVPSVIVPQSQNLLINPLHPGISDIALVNQEPFRFDPRLKSSMKR